MDRAETPRERLQARAAQQLGHFSTRDAHLCGVTKHALQRMLAAGVVVRVMPRAYRFAAVPESDEGDIVAKLLAAGPGTAVARRSALRLLGVACPEPAPTAKAATPAAGGANAAVVHLVRADTTPLCLPGALVHRTRSLPACDVTTLDRAPSIRLTTAARSLIDDVGDLDWIATASLVDEIISRRHATRRWLHRRAQALRDGRPNVGAIVRLTGPQAAGEFWSWLERTSADLWSRHGIPAPEWNVEVRDESGRIGIVDALWQRNWVIAELEGLRFHTSPAQRRQDAERFNRLGRRYRVLRFTWLDVVQRPAYVVDTLRDALGVSGG